MCYLEDPYLRFHCFAAKRCKQRTVATSSMVTSTSRHLANLEILSSVTVALITGAEKNHSKNTTADTKVNWGKKEKI